MSEQSETKIVTLAELQDHSKKDNLYILINGKVYSVAKFIDEHPGGDEVILAEAGKDATEAFEDVGHSDEARELLAGMLVGEFEKGSSLPVKILDNGIKINDKHAPPSQGSSISYFIPLAALAAYFAWRFYFA